MIGEVPRRLLVFAATYQQYRAWLKENRLDETRCKLVGDAFRLRGLHGWDVVFLPNWEQAWSRDGRKMVDDVMMRPAQALRELNHLLPSEFEEALEPYRWVPPGAGPRPVRE